MSVHFLYADLNEKELKQQVCLIKNVENEISNSINKKIKKKKKEREISKNIIQLQKHF